MRFWHLQSWPPVHPPRLSTQRSVRALSMRKAGAHQDLRPLMRLGPPLLKAPKAKREIIQISLATTARKRGISSLIVVKRKRTRKTRRKKIRDLHLVVVQRLSILI